MKRTLINLSLKGTGPQEAFDEIAKQAGVKFSTQGNLWEQDSMQEPIDVDFKDRPFWSAVRELCSEYKLQPQMNFNRTSARRIMLQQVYAGNNANVKRWDELPTAEAGGLLVQATGFNRQQNINYQNTEQSANYCSVTLLAYVDPAIRVSSFKGAAKVEEAVDDNGNSLVPDEKSRMSFGGNTERSMIYSVNVPLKYPQKNPGKKIVKLRCTLSLRGGDKVDTLAVEKPLEAGETSKQFGDLNVTFYSLKKTGNQDGARATYTLKVGFTRDSDDDNGGNNFWNLLQMSQLVDAKGKALNFNGGGGGNNNTFNATFTTRDDGEGASGEPVKWSLELPTGTKTIKVSVEFKDLPMP